MTHWVRYGLGWLLISLLVACQQVPAGPESSTTSTSSSLPSETDTAVPATHTAVPTKTSSPPSPAPTDTLIPPAETGATTTPAGTITGTATTDSSTNDPLFVSPEYGVQLFMWWKPDIGQRDLAFTKEMGFGWVKQSFAWRDIETIEKGAYNWWHADTIVDAVEDAGLKLLVRLDRQPWWSQEPGTDPLENAPPADLQDFADFCAAVAERYAGRIHAYQVWNEPNLSREWGNETPDPAGYTELLRVCYEAIKVADPEAIVISAGLAPTGTTPPLAMPDDEFLASMYAAGAGDYFDVLGLNAPGYKAPPEAAPEEAENPDNGYGNGRWFTFRHVEDMREIMVANGDKDRQVAILEMGWTTDEVNPDYAWFAVDEETQADYLVRAYQYARENWQPWIGLMTTIYIADYTWTAETHEQWWWAIVLPDGTPRPAYNALREMEK